MASKLWERLKKATKAGLPEFFTSPDRGVSPQMQSNIAKQAAQVRFQGIRRMQGRPGITNMGMFPTGGTLPLTAPQAAGFVSGRLQTPYAPELARMTAPDPKAFAEGMRAPEFAEAKLAKRTAAARLTGAEAGTLEEKLPFIGPRETVEIAGLTGEEARKVTAEEERVRGLPTQEQITREHEIVMEKQEREATQADRNVAVDQLTRLAEEARELGRFDRANELERTIFEINSGVRDPASIGGGTLGPGGVGPPAPGLDLFGAPGVQEAPSPAAMQIEQAGDDAVMTRYGFTPEWLETIKGGFRGLGGLGSGVTAAKLQQIVDAIKNAPPSHAEAIIRQVRPLVSEWQKIKIGTESPFEGERKAAELVIELEGLVALNMGGAPDTGGAPSLPAI